MPTDSPSSPSTAEILRATEPLPLVPVTWMTGYAACGSPSTPSSASTGPEAATLRFDGVDLAALEAELDDVAGLRPALQAQARAELAEERLPLTRTTVTVRAVQILHRSRQEVA